MVGRRCGLVIKAQGKEETRNGADRRCESGEGDGEGHLSVNN